MFSSIALVALLLASSHFPKSSLAYVPQPRMNHDSIIFQNLILIYGGQVGVNSSVDKVLITFPIDQPFDTTAPPYYQNSGPRSTGPEGAQMLPGGHDSEELFFYNAGTSQLSIYDQPTEIFTNETWTGPVPQMRDSHSCATNLTTGQTYVFGGETDPDSIALNDLWVLDTIKLQWTFLPGTGSTPQLRQDHTASLTTDGRMVVIGGSGTSATAIISMEFIDIFNTISGIWSSVNASNPPTARVSHTAVCTHDNLIIVFGGDNGNETNPYLGDLIVLDMTVLPLSWTTSLNVSGVPPAPRYGHSATLAGTTMFIIFGEIGVDTLDNNIYALETTSYNWTTSYVPSELDYTWPVTFTTPFSSSNNSEPPPTPTGNGNSNSTEPTSGTPLDVILGGVVGGFGFISIAAVIGGCCLYRRHKRSRAGQEMVAGNKNDFFSQTHLPNSDGNRQNLPRIVSNEPYDGSERPYLVGTNPFRTPSPPSPPSPYSQDSRSTVSYENLSSQRLSETPTFNSLSSLYPSRLSLHQLQTVMEPINFNNQESQSKPDEIK